jgi:hypothetical protein
MAIPTTPISVTLSTIETDTEGTMFKDPRFWTAVVAFGLAALLLGPAVFPVRAPAVAEESIPEIRYVCTKTGEVFMRRLTAAALPHPTTGDSTLVPAVYDPQKKIWKAGPPPEIMHRRGLLRPAS